jgi:hypothetical protein
VTTEGRDAKEDDGDRGQQGSRPTPTATQGDQADLLGR